MKQVILGLAVLATIPGLAWSQAQGPVKPGRVVAEVKGIPITEDQLEKAAAGELLNLALQRERILAAQLELVITARVIALEAEARKLTEMELMQQEVYSKVAEPSTDEVAAYYDASRDMMKETAEKAVPKIRQALITQRRQKLYRDFVDRLRSKYGVKVLLAPLRVDVDGEGRPARGPIEAPVTIVEFSDFECPYCLALSNTLAQIMKDFSGKVRLVFMQYPLTQIHPNAMRAAEASFCAADQGRFWEMHDELFKGGERLTAAELSKRAKAAGLDVALFEACLASGKQAGRIKADIDAATSKGVSSTPMLFINGRPVRGAQPYGDLARIIQEELARAGQKPPPSR
jgi:protein-disulfide isomerase